MSFRDAPPARMPLFSICPEMVLGMTDKEISDILPSQIKDYGKGFLKSLPGISCLSPVPSRLDEPAPDASRPQAISSTVCPTAETPG